MRKISATLLSFGLSTAIMTSVAFAQASAPAPAAPTDRKALSKECSQQADAKGLHGKARKRFRDACKRGQTGAAQ